MRDETAIDQLAGGCCSPGPLATGDAAAPAAHDRPIASAPVEASGGHRVDQAAVPAQTFAMGDALGDGAWGDGETPVHPVTLDAFSIDATSVTNDDFARFVDETGFVTVAESSGFSAVFHLDLAGDDDDVLGRPPGTPWWLGVRGADWRHPGGRRSDLDGLGAHPVVHVSWDDAIAYCAWAGRELPTEAQWEAAARGGLDGARYPWGDELGTRDGESGPWPVNIWQGRFPYENTAEDGWATTAPARSYRPNAYGVWQPVGNVWEWCSDAWAVDTYARDAASGVVRDPRGPTAEAASSRVIRGGSFLCHDSYCNRYRVAARSSNTPDSSTSNTGFRTVSRRG